LVEDYQIEARHDDVGDEISDIFVPILGMISIRVLTPKGTL
jgi:hypothetical protein